MNTFDGNRAVKPDAQAFDRIEIITIPRYKTSGLSGDEWRISAEIIFYRKGKEISRVASRNVETAARHLAYQLDAQTDEGRGFFAGESDLCDQEGCNNSATVRADKKYNYCREGHKTPLSSPMFRLFCDKHKERGDCGLDDADANYDFSPLP